MKILHVFPPSLRTRFGGQNVTWKYNFNFWSEPSVEHYCLEVKENQVLPAKISFDFDYPSRQSPNKKWKRALWTIQIMNRLQRFAGEYDIIHFHVLWWGTLMAARWAKKRNIPTIYESILLDADTPGNILKERFGKTKVRLLENFTNILAISDFLAQDYLNNNFSQEKVVTLMNSVDTQLFHPSLTQEEKLGLRQKLGLPIDSTILIFVGSVIHRKGVDILIESFIEAQKKQEELFLIIVGPHKSTDNPSIDENFIKMLEDKINQENLRSKVLFMGLVKNRQDLAEIYQASDIFVFPSRQEGLGNVVLEAMACGLPVIVSDLPVLKAVVTDMVDGLKVPMNDPLTLENSVYTLMNDENLCRSIKEKAREYVLNNHSFNAWQSALTQIYDTLSDQKHILRNTTNGEL